MKDITLFFVCSLWLVLAGYLTAGCGDIASTRSETVNTQDNSVDNSQTGISSCEDGSTLVCDVSGGPGSFTQTRQCVNVNGQPVILDGPEPIDDDIAEACPTPFPTPAPIALSETPTTGNDFSFNG